MKGAKMSQKTSKMLQRSLKTYTVVFRSIRQSRVIRVPAEDEIWSMSRVTEASAKMTERVTQTPQKSTENGPKIEKNC
jgi:hypothetical protein